ncbi:hypothetical protein CISIN_1g0086352mg, partial [Citrus sinensis]
LFIGGWLHTMMLKILSKM